MSTLPSVGMTRITVRFTSNTYDVESYVVRLETVDGQKVAELTHDQTTDIQTGRYVAVLCDGMKEHERALIRAPMFQRYHYALAIAPPSHREQWEFYLKGLNRFDTEKRALASKALNDPCVKALVDAKFRGIIVVPTDLCTRARDPIIHSYPDSLVNVESKVGTVVPQLMTMGVNIVAVTDLLVEKLVAVIYE